jgi:hypothetical protein
MRERRLGRDPLPEKPVQVALFQPFDQPVLSWLFVLQWLGSIAVVGVDLG